MGAHSNLSLLLDTGLNIHNRANRACTWDFGTYRICANTFSNAHADVSSGARGIHLALSLSLLPYFVNV